MHSLKIDITSSIIERLVHLGVSDFCVCPAARNASFVSLLDNQELFKPFYFYEERSAAFFALGRARQANKPVAIITTSGTAAGELLPAVMEAYYTGVPLILITADRPRRFRGTGAPQAAEQVNLFGPYASLSLDLSADEPFDLSLWDQQSPLHLNVCLEDPNSKNTPYLTSRKEEPLIDLDHFFDVATNPLIVVSALKEEEREAVLNFLVEVCCPVFLEGVSGLRENEKLKHLQVKNPEAILKRAAKLGYPIDAILRIGGVPTFRLWRDLEDLDSIKVFSVCSLPFKGLTYGQLVHTQLDLFFKSYVVKKRSYQWTNWLMQESVFQDQLETLFNKELAASASLIHHLSKQLPNRSHIYLGNSLPIREWDLAACYKDQKLHVTASRGLNGIDGQMSTFFGLCSKERDNFAILGDLTTLYDMAAPWILPQMKELSATVFVINNGGGQIFSRMFASEVFQNKHDLHFKPVAEMWGMEYERFEGEIKPLKFDNKPRLIEIIPDNLASNRLLKQIADI